MPDSVYAGYMFNFVMLEHDVHRQLPIAWLDGCFRSENPGVQIGVAGNVSVSLSFLFPPSISLLRREVFDLNDVVTAPHWGRRRESYILFEA